MIGAGVPAVWATAVLELPHDPHVFAPDLTPLKGRSGAGQYGRQHLTGHRPSGCQPVSISDPAPRRPLTDMQPPRQNIGMRGTSEFNRRGLGGHRRHQPQPSSAEPTLRHSDRANTANASEALNASIASAQKASTAAPNTPIEYMFGR
ncbi:hypothetical protein NJBCHELONAE_16280 [Mycobacteroides chelonae]|nr:hypothetical protein NJBCHELONAE_16280 [Mycobacteroides chelonae]